MNPATRVTPDRVHRVHLALGALIVLLMGIGGARQARAEESHPGIAIESMYSEAVLAFNKKQPDQVLRVLEDLLKVAPNHVEALELKALTLKSGERDPESLEVYRKLISLKPPEERGPYHFETALILHRQKKPREAKPHFEKAIEMKFNETTSHLFLGLMGFAESDLKSAQRSFEKVKSDGSTELQVVARYYLGLIHFKNGYGAGGTAELTAARNLAADIPESKMASDIGAAADKVLAPFNREQWFGNVALVGQYDSNISLRPPGESTASTSASGKATGKLNLSAGFGRMSSPMKTIQWVASYRVSYNKNLNANTRSYEFFSNVPALFLNYKPLGTTTGGLKLEGSFAFQNLPVVATETTGSYIFQKYNLGGEAGPFFKHQMSRQTQLQGDFSFRSQKYFTDSDLSGSTILSRFAIRHETSQAWLSPGAALSYERNYSKSTDARYWGAGLGLSNALRLGSDTSASVSLDVLLTRYPAASIARTDRTMTARLGFTRALAPKWALIGDLSYIKNASSSAASNSYDRVIGGVGVSWVL